MDPAERRVLPDGEGIEEQEKEVSIMHENEKRGIEKQGDKEAGMIPILQVKICEKSRYPDKQQKTVYLTVLQRKLEQTQLCKEERGKVKERQAEEANTAAVVQGLDSSHRFVPRLPTWGECGDTKGQIAQAGSWPYCFQYLVWTGTILASTCCGKIVTMLCTKNVDIESKIATLVKLVEKRTSSLSWLLKTKNVHQMRPLVIWENSLINRVHAGLFAQVRPHQSDKLPVTKRSRVMKSSLKDDSRCKSQTEGVSVDAAVKPLPALEKGLPSMYKEIISADGVAHCYSYWNYGIPEHLDMYEGKQVEEDWYTCMNVKKEAGRTEKSRESRSSLLLL
ncbi:hypothetical protein DUI87_16398 [Hirundo rustica rustica]|uniref:Uncharacterized protein n=1 Tax=Hirundo rustica rustica TaxID=333673 RepID=A0A3M0K1D2_HIRRU|nr:hypothetical protein DUI87_16398 [Hirundo rustica rustica]